MQTNSTALTPGEASAILTVLYEVSQCDGWPQSWEPYLTSAWDKLIDTARDKPVTIYAEDDGWYLVVNGSTVNREPFESEARALFYWQCRPREIAT